MNKDELWYIVERHSNMRLHSKDGPLIHDDYDAARNNAAQISKLSGDWNVPIRVSEYHEIYG